MPELSAAPSINDSRTRALLELVARLTALDLGPLLVYRLDSVPASALPLLAWQFDILSPLWQLIAPVVAGVDALTDIDLLIDIDNLIESGGALSAIGVSETAQREMLKSAILLHRFRGTPWAVRQALAALGWSDVALLEGEASWGGAVYPSDQGWAVFRAMINLSAGQGVPAGVVSPATIAVYFFKPARAWLDSIWFVSPPIAEHAPLPRDLLTLGGIASYQLDAARDPADGQLTIAISPAPLADAYPIATPFYDGHYQHSGITYDTNEPRIADPALLLNGAAVLHGG